MVATRSEGPAGKARAVLASLVGRVRQGPEEEDLAAPAAAPTLAAAARAAGWRSNRAGRAFLADLDALLARRPRGRVAVLGEDVSGGVHRVVRRAYPRARVLRFDPSLGAAERHVRLAAHGRFDVVVWEPSPTPPTVQLVEELLFHLKKGGALLLRYARPGRDTGADPCAGPRELAAALLVRLGERGQDPKMLSRAVERVVAGRLHVVVVNHMVALAKVREGEANEFLSLRGPRSGRVLTQLPAVEFESRCDLREDRASRTDGMFESYDVPAMSLREYRRVTCVPRQIVLQRNVLLPDTYRHNAAARLTNRFTREVAPRFARLPARTSRARPLEGSYFHLDSEWPAHFGHVMTEQLSRLWALQAAREAHPDLKVLLSRRPGMPLDLTQFERPILAAAGVTEREVVLFDAPVRVDCLVAATPMFSAPRYVHPELSDVWKRTGDALCAAAADRRYPARIFCSRREQRRRCHNSDEVEARFAAAGFEVVFPEDFPIEEQARMSREADVVAGFAGSGLLSLMFAPSPKHVIVLSPTSYTARNEYMICSVLGHRMDVVWSESDIPQPAGGWDANAVRSGFTFDFAQEGVRLDRILAEL